jgi:hypothetical protein
VLQFGLKLVRTFKKFFGFVTQLDHPL